MAALSVDEQLAAIADTFAALDSQAASCLETLSEQGLGQTSQNLTAACQSFLAAIDGEPTTSYIQHCRQLQQWRSDFVERSRSAADTSNDPDALRRLIDIEYFCGANALRLRTDNVASAFQRLQPSRNNVRPGPGIPQSSPTPDNHRRQMRRLNNETNRQQQQLEMELLEQRIERRQNLQ